MSVRQGNNDGKRRGGREFCVSFSNHRLSLTSVGGGWGDTDGGETHAPHAWSGAGGSLSRPGHEKRSPILGVVRILHA